MKYDLSLLEILFENLQVPCYVLDTDGNTLYANAATFQMYNCSPEFYQQYYSNSYAMTEAGCFGEKREAAFSTFSGKRGLCPFGTKSWT